MNAHLVHILAKTHYAPTPKSVFVFWQTPHFAPTPTSIFIFSGRKAIVVLVMPSHIISVTLSDLILSVVAIMAVIAAV